MGRWLQWLMPRVKLPCPFCGQFGLIRVDEGAGEHQTFTQPCSMCAHDLLVHLDLSFEAGGSVRVWLERGDDPFQSPN